mgnify:CR=1 FL=1
MRRARDRRVALLAALGASALLGAPQMADAGALDGRVILVDAGHNGRNWSRPDVIGRQVWAGNRYKDCDTTGTASASGYDESAYNWDVARRLTIVLQRMGARVVLTRRGDGGVGPCIDRRARIGNRAHADVAISIHADGNDAPSARGFHVIRPLLVRGYNDGIPVPSRRLARLVRDAFHARTGMPLSTYVGTAGIIARDDLGGLNLSRVPKVLVETGNMRNARDMRLLGSPAWRARAARALAAALRSYLAPPSA